MLLDCAALSALNKEAKLKDFPAKYIHLKSAFHLTMEEVLRPGAFITADSFCALPDTYSLQVLNLSARK